MSGLFSWLRNRRQTREMQRERYRSVFGCEMLERSRAGEVSTEDYEKCESALQDSTIVDELITRSQNPALHGDNFVGTFDWETIWQWIKDNWLEILKMVLTIALFFLEKRPKDAEAT